MKRAYYSDSIPNFLSADPNAVMGQLVSNSEFAVEQTQCDAWLHQIEVLKSLLQGRGGTIYLEYSIPRMGKRVDVVLLNRSFPDWHIHISDRLTESEYGAGIV